MPTRVTRPPDPRQLGGATWTSFDPAGLPLLLVPLGSCEQHGPHLPLDTDLRVAEGVAARAARRLGPGVLVGPSITVGASGEHAGFPGTLSMGTPVLTEVLVELVRSADPTARGVVLVNGHGGNTAALASAVQRCRAEGRHVLGWAPSLPGGDAHAGRTETSLLLHLAPGLVRRGRPGGTVAPMSELLPRLRAEGVRAVSPTGVLGDARGASAAEGRRLLAGVVSDLVQAVRAFS